METIENVVPENSNNEFTTNLFVATAEYYRHAFDYQSRATRADYWWAYLGSKLLGFLAMAISGLAMWYIALVLDFQVEFTMVIVSTMWVSIYVLNFIPLIAITARRLRDLKYNPLLTLFLIGNVIPIFSMLSLILFVFTLLPSELQTNPIARQHTQAVKGFKKWILAVSVVLIVSVGSATLIWHYVVQVIDSDAPSAKIKVKPEPREETATRKGIPHMHGSVPVAFKPFSWHDAYDGSNTFFQVTDVRLNPSADTDSPTNKVLSLYVTVTNNASKKQSVGLAFDVYLSQSNGKSVVDLADDGWTDSDGTIEELRETHFRDYDEIEPGKKLTGIISFEIISDKPVKVEILNKNDKTIYQQVIKLK